MNKKDVEKKLDAEIKAFKDVLGIGKKVWTHKDLEPDQSKLLERDISLYLFQGFKVKCLEILGKEMGIPEDEST